MKKIIFYAILCLLLIGVVIGVSGQLSSFYGQTNPFNITFESGVNQTIYLEIPRYAYVENITINLTGRATS